MDFNFLINPNAESLYQSGFEFQKAAERCLNIDTEGKIQIVTDGIIHTLPAPAVVNSTLACELYFKALILKSGKSYPTNKNGHNLKYLYEMLPVSMQDNICKFCMPKSIDAKKKFTNFLDDHSRDFIDTRYYATKSGWQKMSPIVLYQYTFNIGKIAKFLLANWEES